MENWIAGLSLVKEIAYITMGNANGSKQDVRRLVQDELRTSQNREHSEILRGILKALEDSGDRREEEMKLKAKVEELTEKMDKLDREKKSSETRTWMKELLEKMILAGAERSHQYKQEGRWRGRGQGRPPHSYRPNHDVKNDNDHLPWTDGPKGGQNRFQPTDDTFVFVNHGDFHSNPHGGRNFYRGGFHRGRGQQHRPMNYVQHQQERDNVPQQKYSHRGHNNYQQRGNYRGQGQGAVPKTSRTRTPSNDSHGNQGTDEIKQLTAKLMNLSASDVSLSFTREEVLAIKNALKEKEKKASENQQKGKPKQQEQQEQQKKKKKNTNRPRATPNWREEDEDEAEKPANEVPNPPPRTTPSQIPVQMLPLTGLNDSFFHLLPANQVLEDAMLVAKEDGRVITLQPRTVQEMRDFKSKHPSAEVFAIKPSDS